MHVRLAPPTHTLPSMKRIDRIPSRAMAAPWEASYDGGACPESMSQCAMPALTLPQTGSSRTPIGNAKARTSNCWGDPGIGTNNPEHELTHAGIVGFEGQYVRGAGQTDCSPTRSVVNPVVIEDVTTVDSQSPGDAIEVFVIERPCSAQC